MDSRADDRLHREFQRPVVDRKAQSPRIPEGRVYDGHALFRRQETHLSVQLTKKGRVEPYKSLNNLPEEILKIRVSIDLNSNYQKQYKI